MSYDMTFNDTFPLVSAVSAKDTKVAKRHGIPLFKGVLYEELDDGYGNVLLKKLNDNTVVIGGAILALEHLTGVTSCWKPSTLNSIYNLNADKSATASDLNTRICLFGAGIGGATLNYGNLIDPDTKQRDLLEPVPLRYGSSLIGTGTEKYMFKIPEPDGSTFKWMLKEFEDAPVIRSMWKDAVEEGEDIDGTEINEEIYNSTRKETQQTFAEYHLKFDKDDVHEYFKSIGELQMARYNTIGLYTGTKVMLEDGSYDYVNVRLFSCVSFNNKEVSTKTKSTYRYRIFSLV